MRTERLSAEQRKLLEQLLDAKGVARARPRITAREVDRATLPLSFAQQRMWFFNQLAPTATIYNIAGAARMRGKLDIAVLQCCLDEVVRRHEVLRSTFHQVDGRTVQRVDPARPVPMPVIDLRDLEPAQRDATVAARCAEEADRPFDLGSDLLLRPVLLRLADDDQLLLLSQHHIGTDGWSLGLLLRELGLLYGAYVEGKPSPLPEPTVQYGDFAIWQREWLSGDTLEEHLAYWRERLAGAGALDLPTGRLRPAERTWSGGCVDVALPAELVRGLKALGDTERATLFMVLLATVGTLFQRWSGQQDIVLGVPVANRNQAETEALAGSFVNTLPMRLDLTGEPTFRDLLRRARQEALGAYAHQDVPIEKIIEDVNPEREATAHTPLIRHMLGLHNTPWEELALPDLTVDLEPLDTGKARFDLEFELSPTDEGGLTGYLWFASDLFDRDTVQRLCDGLHTLLTGALANPDAPTWQLPIVTAQPTPAPEPTTPFLDRFAHWVRTTPNAPAIDELDYQSLDAAADRLAGQLTAGERVALLLPPTDLAVATVALAKLGAIGIPLDPSLPDDDIRAALTRTGPHAVLTTSAGPNWLSELDELQVHLLDRMDSATQDDRRPADAALLVESSGGRFIRLGTEDIAAQLNRADALCPIAPGTRFAGPGTVPGLLWPLASGATVVTDPTQANTLLTTPSQLDTVRAERVIVTGEQLWPEGLPDTELYYGYALAETGFVAGQCVHPGPAELTGTGRVALGRALPGADLRVLDEHGLPVPIGVAGELHVGDLATGDRVRRTPEGGWEFLGAAQAFAVRGRPVEPGDVTTELHAHPLVAQAHTTLPQGESALAAYVTLAADPASGDTARWREEFENNYLGRDPDEDPTLNATGWTSPHTGEYLAPEAMRIWLDSTVRNVLDLRPAQVLEIGVRTGVLLFRLAPRCESYLGTDVSARALRHIDNNRRRLAAKSGSVSLDQRAPDDFTGLADGAYDTVLLNDLTGYLAGPEQLAELVTGAVRVLRPGGRVFIGGVLSRRQRELVGLDRQLDRLPADTPFSRLRALLAKQAAEAGELAVDPEFFADLGHRLPGVGRVSMLLRAAAPGSDLSSLRYDIVLHLDDPSRSADPEPQWLDWPGIDDLPALLSESGPDLIGLRGVPHAGQYRQRKAADLLAGAGTVGDLAAALGAEPDAVDPTDLVAVATAHGYQIIVGGRISGEPGLLEVILRRRQADATTSLTELLAEPVGPADWQASDPSWAGRARAAVPLLRNHLRERLASNAVPGRIEVLARWPLADTGRLDPAALPVGDEDATAEAEADEQPLVEPRTETEQVVARIWSDVLGADRIGVHDDFFSLGGHSLMGAEVIDQVREHFKIDLPLGQLFETPTVAAVAGFVDREKERPRQDATPIRRINRAEYRRASVSGADRRD